MNYSEIISLVEGAEYVDFAPFGEGIGNEWIDKAETRLGFSLPESYKWWLKNFAGGEISGEEIFSIYEMDFDTVNGGDVVYMSIINEKNGLCGKDKLFICEASGTSESFYFAIEEKDNEGEYPVYRLDLTDNSSELYAKNFIGFLCKRINIFS